MGQWVEYGKKEEVRKPRYTEPIVQRGNGSKSGKGQKPNDNLVQKRTESLSKKKVKLADKPQESLAKKKVKPAEDKMPEQLKKKSSVRQNDKRGQPEPYKVYVKKEVNHPPEEILEFRRAESLRLLEIEQ